MKWFTEMQLSKHITRITDITGTHMYLVQGNKQAMLIDTGCGIGDLRSFIRSFTELPLVVLCTHGHMDHAGGAAQFSEVYMNLADVELSYTHCTVKNRLAYLEITKERMGCALPIIKDTDFIPVRMQPYLPLDSGMVFDLGEYPVRVLALPGHTAGSMCMLFEQERSILLGDACNKSVFLFDQEAATVTEYKKSLKDFEQYECLYDTVYLSHGEDLTVDRAINRACIEVCNEIINGEDEKVPFLFMGGVYRSAHSMLPSNMRTDGGLATIIYHPERI